MPRAFLAIKLPQAVRSTFVACRHEFVTADPDWQHEKWVAEENLHVTLRFLGTVPDCVCPEVADRVARALSASATYRLTLDVARAIPRPRSASLLWIGPSSGGEETSDIAARIALATSFLDFEPDGRAFKTHVTLCRARRPRRVSTAGIDALEHLLHRSDERATTMSVREVTLFRSTLTPRGPVYDELAVIPLAG